MILQRRAEPEQLGLSGETPLDRWLSMSEALALFDREGAEETVLLRRAEEGTIRTRLSDRGYEFHPLDAERWARLEGAIEAGRRGRNGGASSAGTPTGRRSA